jgi:hypothetical protein
MKIDHNHVFRAHHAFAETGGRNQYAVLIQPDRKVSVGGGNKTHAVEHLAKAGKLLSQFALRAE